MSDVVPHGTNSRQPQITIIRNSYCPTPWFPTVIWPYLDLLIMNHHGRRRPKCRTKTVAGSVAQLLVPCGYTLGMTWGRRLLFYPFIIMIYPIIIRIILEIIPLSQCCPIISLSCYPELLSRYPIIFLSCYPIIPL